MTYKFKDALDKISELGDTASLFEIDGNVIRQALRIASRLTEEPAHEVLVAISEG